MSEAAANSNSSSQFPPPLDQLADRDFSFYPSIDNVPENFWHLVEPIGASFWWRTRRTRRRYGAAALSG